VGFSIFGLNFFSFISIARELDF